MLSTDKILEFRELLNRLWETYEENAEFGSCIWDVGTQRYALKIVEKLPVLSNMLEDQKSYIFVCEANTSPKLPSAGEDWSAAATTTFSSVQCEEQLDLTGCPLECPFSPNDSVVDQIKLLNNGKLCNAAEPNKHESVPLNSSTASGIVSLFREASRQTVHQSENFRKWSVVPIVVFCDGRDCESTVLLGIQRTRNGSKHFRVKCNGSACFVGQLPNFDIWKKDHLLGISHNMVETEASAQFAVLKKSLDEVSKFDSSSNIILECEWKNVHQLLEAPNETAVCTVHFTVVVGDPQSRISARWNELRILEDLFQYLSDDNATWMCTQTEMLREVTQLLDEMTLVGNRKRVTRAVKDKPLETDLMKELLKDTRTNLDFTDKLWTVLKGCKSHTELCTCLNFVLQRIQSGEVNPVIFSVNKTRLGTLITDIYKKKVEIPCLDLLNPLKLLVEIGVEKLKQDYISAFLLSGLVSKENLKPIVNTIDATSEDSLKSLYKLHCVLDLIVLCKMHINPTDALLSTYARLALSQVSSGSFDSKCYQFSFLIDKQIVHEFFLSHSPKKWQVSLKSSQNTYKVQTIIFLSTEDTLRMGFAQDKHSDFSDAGLPYYCYISTTVQDAF